MPHLSEADVQRIAEAVAGKLDAGGLGHDQASNIAAAAARTAVQEYAAKSLALLGIDPANSKHIDALKANLAFVQRLRIRSESIGQSVSNAVANAVALALLALLLLGTVMWFRGAPVENPAHIIK